jgi:hypothetical protein
MPIYDLDERTTYLWEQIGNPTSSILGAALVVSADAPDSAIGCNRNIFRTLSGALEALPQVINYPILIEIASFGQLGDLVLDNYKFGPRGSLEIINRNFSRQESIVSTVGNSQYTPTIGLSSITNNPYFYLSGVKINAGYDASNALMSPLQGFLNASCMSIACPVFSGTRDSRLSGTGGTSKLNAFISTRHHYDNYYSRSTLVIDDKNTTQPYGSNNFDINFAAYDLFSPDSFDEIGTKDASTVSFFNNQHLFDSVNDAKFNGLYYGNKLNKIYISNCNGPIFIRNFFLDGSGFNKSGNDNGVEVNNSNDIFLENIVVCRYRKAGFLINNSKVIFLRSNAAQRIYDFNSDGTRKTDSYATRRVNLTRSTEYLRDDLGAGLIANNSNINFSSTHQREYSLLSSLLGPANVPLPNNYQAIEFSKCANGIILNNSTLVGGKPLNSSYAAAQATDFEMYLRCAHNVGAGILLANSKMFFEGSIRVQENLNGVIAEDSILELDRIYCTYNQHKGLIALNSKIITNKNLNTYHIAGSLRGTAILFYGNGQNLLLDNSIYKPTYTSGMENYYGNETYQECIGKIFNTSSSDFGALESVRLQNGSEAVFISPRMSRTLAYSVPGSITNIWGFKGSDLHLVNNSKATLKGTRYFTTKFQGPLDYQTSKGLAAICAENNSTLIINGPTVVYQYGIDLLAEDNSKILISPPKDSTDQQLDISSITLADPFNHTAVELHSTRACIVVNKNSSLDIKDLGSYRTHWSKNSYSSIVQSSGVDYQTISPAEFELYTSGGSLQFYPNPIAPANGTGYGLGSVYGAEAIVSPVAGADKFATTRYPARGLQYLVDLNSTPINFSAATFGGMCVRALNNSIVNVHNVNFPTGWWNCSSPFYDGTKALTAGTACDRLFIWNIADTSKLKASYLSVSGLFPKSAEYVGPFGYWVSASNNRANYGLPSSTPDTSSLSVLDNFGRNPSGTAFSTTAADNYGVFRLYFSVDPMANSLSYSNNSADGFGSISQIYAQGYQPSTSLICNGFASSIYLNSRQRNSLGVIQPSGYYYGKDMVIDALTQNVILDESAANTFANAKHCASGKSNAAKKVAIYYPYTQVNQGDSASLLGIGSVNMFDIERIN